MAIFEIQGPDGTTYEVEADTLEQAASAFNPETFSQASQNSDAIRALERLEREGTIRPAEAEALNALRQGQTTGQNIIGEAGAAYRGALQGATFNFADEIGGVMGMDKQGIRDRNAQAERLYPDQYSTGKLAGGVASGLATAPIGGGYIGGAKSIPGIMARSGAVGGAEGALWGAGEGEGMGKIPSAVRSGAFGAFLGAAAPPAVGLGVKAAQGIGDAVMGGIDAAINRGSQGRAQRAIAEALSRSGRTGPDVASAITAAAREGQPEFRMMDAMGVAGQRLASGVTRAGGEGSEQIAQFLRQRQLDQSDRMAGFVTDAYGAQETAAQATARLNTERKVANNQNYAAARQAAGPVNLNDTIDTIDSLLKRNPIIGESGLASSEIGNRLTGLRNRLTSDSEQLIDFDSVLNTKEDLGAIIGQMKRRGEEVPFELAQVYSKLDEALEASSDSYRVANDTARAGRQVISAVDEGAQMARPGSRYIDTTARFNQMNAAEQAAARVGYGDKALAKIEANAAPAADKSRPFRSTKATEEANAMALDAPLFERRVQREGDMWETQNRALGGSRTADNLQDIQNTGAAANIMRALRDAGNLQFGQAAGNIGAAIGPALTGRNDATRKLIADMLMSAQANDVLAPVARMEIREQLIRRLLEGGVRGGGREITP